MSSVDGKVAEESVEHDARELAEIIMSTPRVVIERAREIIRQRRKRQ